MELIICFPLSSDSSFLFQIWDTLLLSGRKIRHTFVVRGSAKPAKAHSLRTYTTANFNTRLYVNWTERMSPCGGKRSCRGNSSEPEVSDYESSPNPIYLVCDLRRVCSCL